MKRKIWKAETEAEKLNEELAKELGKIETKNRKAYERYKK